ncbi:MAG TPA: hypothetical protein VEY12_06925 [Thermoplasmata archaeon]|nr:hypothetical protein [Thermoplasmata archaeon]
MAVIAKIGVLEHRGKVRTPEGVFEVGRPVDGWYPVGGPPAEGPGRVRYNPDREVLDIARPGSSLSIAFRPDVERTVFEFRGHRYEVASMDFGNVLIREGSQLVVRGHVTIGGVRLVSVAPDLLPIERELAFGLALRGSALDEDYWRDEHVLTEWSKQQVEDLALHEDKRRRHEDG